MDTKTRHRPARPVTLRYPDLPDQSSLSGRHMFVAADGKPATVNLWDEARIPARKDRDAIVADAIVAPGASNGP